MSHHHAAPISHRPSQPPDFSVLSLKDLGVTLQGRAILEHLSYEATVTRLGIVGRNGSGKSTFARVLAGLLSPSSGSVRVNGINLAENRKAALMQVGILFQNPDHQIIFPTVLEEISFGLTQQGHKTEQAQERACETLARFGKENWKEAAIHTLSQGQKHLVCLMSIIAMTPKMIILDEPFAGLDLPTKMQLNSALNVYQGSLVHISHDPRDLADYEHVLWLEQGRLVDQGAPEQVLARYHSEMIKIGERDDLFNITD